ncbi:MAG: hypothetical protein NDI61_12325, partial [Bdellovibrionaceae bacterium]|nr:hypothetical protein [Pseudobdellovibrionaceae bacterium]
MRPRNSFLLMMVLAICALVLPACNEIDVIKGEIPAEHIEAAEPYMGEYQGRFDDRLGVLKLELRDRYVVLSFVDAQGGDLLPGCGARIGDLKTVGVKEKSKKYSLRRAKFDFDPGSCANRIEGRILQLEFFSRYGRDMIDISILQETREETSCTIEPGDPNRGIPPRETCRSDSRPIYINGL